MLPRALGLRRPCHGGAQGSCALKTEDAHWEGVPDKYKRYEANVCRILRSQSALQQVAMLYISAYSLHKTPDSAWTLSLFKGSEGLVTELSRFYSLWGKYGEKLGLSKEVADVDGSALIDDAIAVIFSKLRKHVSWHMGMMAYKLIKIEKKREVAPEKEDETDEQKKLRTAEAHRKQVLQMVGQSNLLSGGIERKHMRIFSVKAREELTGMAQLMNDSALVADLAEKKHGEHGTKDVGGEDDVDCDDCDILEAVVFEGKNEETDLTIEYLQKMLEQ